MKKETLTKQKKKASLIDLIFKKEPKRYTVEDTIPYLRMLKSGICQLDEKHYNKCIAFQDINYQLALEEDKDCRCGLRTAPIIFCCRKIENLI